MTLPAILTFSAPGYGLDAHLHHLSFGHNVASKSATTVFHANGPRITCSISGTNFTQIYGNAAGDTATIGCDGRMG